MRMRNPDKSTPQQEELVLSISAQNAQILGVEGTKLFVIGNQVDETPRLMAAATNMGNALLAEGRRRVSKTRD